MMASDHPNQPSRASMSGHANGYIREVLHAPEAPPPVPVRYFYTSPLAIDDPLSALPPPLTASSVSRKHPPQPFSIYDNDALNSTWLDLRRKILKYNEEGGEKRGSVDVGGRSKNPILVRLRKSRDGSSSSERSTGSSARGMDIPSSKFVLRVAESESVDRQTDETPGTGMASLSTSLRALEPTDVSTSADATNTTGNPFIRAPSRTNIYTAGRQRLPEGRQRPGPHELDSYKWDDNMEPDVQSNKE